MSRAQEIADLLSGVTITTADNNAQLTLKSTDADDTSGPRLDLTRDSGSPADGDTIGRIRYLFDNDAAEQIEGVRVNGIILDASDGTEDCQFEISTRVAGDIRSRIKLGTETVFNEASQDIDFRVESNGNANMINVDAGNDLVGIGGVPDTSKLTVYGQVGTTNGTEGAPTHSFYSDTDTGMFRSGGNTLAFSTGGTTRTTIDSSGNVLVNQSSTTSPGLSNTTAGLCFSDSGRVFSSASGAASSFNRNTSDGAVIHVRKAGTLVGVLSVTDSDNFSIDCQTSSHSGLTFGTANILPRVNGSNNDGNVDLGSGSNRFQNIYATNATIQTSDESEKQNIATLTSAEITAAKAISKLFKTFKWQHRVSEEGDAARTHAGVIAQEVQTAMTDAGLDAADYAFWCSDTWWETSTEVAAVEADEEAGIEAKDAYTRIDTYQTADEAPEGATKRTRLGVRYAELMSFIGAATEQRLADIETRLSALEAD